MAECGNFDSSNEIKVVKLEKNERLIGFKCRIFEKEHSAQLHNIQWMLSKVEEVFELNDEEPALVDLDLKRQRTFVRKRPVNDEDIGKEDFDYLRVCKDKEEIKICAEKIFRIIDLDNNGVISRVEVQAFYDKQVIKEHGSAHGQLVHFAKQKTFEMFENYDDDANKNLDVDEFTFIFTSKFDEVEKE